MKPKKPKRVRKPGHRYSTSGDSTLFPDRIEPIFIGSKHFNIKQAKKLHAWLGRAIKYLEHGER